MTFAAVLTGAARRLTAAVLVGTTVLAAAGTAVATPVPPKPAEPIAAVAPTSISATEMMSIGEARYLMANTDQGTLRPYTAALREYRPTWKVLRGTVFDLEALRPGVLSSARKGYSVAVSNGDSPSTVFTADHSVFAYSSPAAAQYAATRLLGWLSGPRVNLRGGAGEQDAYHGYRVTAMSTRNGGLGFVVRAKYRFWCEEQVIMVRGNVVNRTWAHLDFDGALTPAKVGVPAVLANIATRQAAHGATPYNAAIHRLALRPVVKGTSTC